MHTIVGSNQFMAELQARVVPAIVEYEDFWSRYFFKYGGMRSPGALRMKLRYWACLDQVFVSLAQSPCFWKAAWIKLTKLVTLPSGLFVFGTYLVGLE